MRSYVLGELSETEQQQVEEQYFADPQLLDELLAVRDELLDALARGALTGTEREKLTARLAATPALQKKLAFARLLAQELNAGEFGARQGQGAAGAAGGKNSAQRGVAAKRNFWSAFARQPGLAWAALLLLLLSGAWLVVRLRQQAQPVTPTERLAVQTAPSPTASATAPFIASDKSSDAKPRVSPTLLATGKPPRAATTSSMVIASFLLTADAVRSEEQPLPLVIPTSDSPDALVQLHLELPTNAALDYRAVLQTGKGAAIWQNEQVKVQDGAVAVLIVPAAKLASGDYLLKLFAAAGPSAELIGSYQFAVQRK